VPIIFPPCDLIVRERVSSVLWAGGGCSRGRRSEKERSGPPSDLRAETRSLLSLRAVACFTSPSHPAVRQSSLSRPNPSEFFLFYYLPVTEVSRPLHRSAQPRCGTHRQFIPFAQPSKPAVPIPHVFDEFRNLTNHSLQRVGIHRRFRVRSIGREPGRLFSRPCQALLDRIRADILHGEVSIRLKQKPDSAELAVRPVARLASVVDLDMRAFKIEIGFAQLAEKSVFVDRRSHGSSGSRSMPENHPIGCPTPFDMPVPQRATPP
jgi:hypothetical protein